MQKGTVKWFNASKGYGFITKEDGEDVFVHFSSLTGSGLRNLYEGDRVSFEVTDDGRGPAAVNVVVDERGIGKRRERKELRHFDNGETEKSKGRDINKRRNGNRKSAELFQYDFDE